MERAQQFISAVVYLHNDAERAPAFLRALYQQLNEHFARAEVLCVDDCSADATCDAVRLAAREMPGCEVTLVRMSATQGVETAMRAGVGFAIGDFVFEFDSALMDYDAGLMMQVYQRALEGYDMVSAVPQGKARRSSRWFYRVFNRAYPGSFAFTTERFRVISRRLINRVLAQSAQVPYRKVAYAASGLSCDALPYTPLPSAARSRDRQLDGIRRDTAIDALMLFTNVAFRFAVLMCVAMAACTLFAGLYTIVVFALGDPVSGWTTTMLLLSGGFFGVFAILTMALKYLSIVVRLLFRKQAYTISAIEKVSR